MGSRYSESVRRFALLTSLMIAVILVLSEGGLNRIQAQDVAGGAVSVKFAMDTLPIGPGVLCQGDQYKILIQTVQATGNVSRHIHAGIEVETALNPISPKYLDLPESQQEGIFYYDAKNIGQDTISYTAYQKTVLSPDAGGAQPQIGEGSLNVEVKECPYKVTMVYTYEFPLGTVVGLMAETPLAKNPDGSLTGDGPFDFQQWVNAAPCVADFAAISAPTHIDGSLDTSKHVLTLKFKYSTAKTTIDATCPIVGSASASHNRDVSSIGVPQAQYPEEGGARSWPALGGKLTIIVNREVK